MEDSIGFAITRDVNKSLKDNQSAGTPLNFGSSMRGNLALWKHVGMFALVWDRDWVDDDLGIVSISGMRSEVIFSTETLMRHGE